MTLLLSPWQKIFGFTFSFWSLGEIGVFFRSLSWGYVTPSEQTVTIRKSQKRSTLTFHLPVKLQTKISNGKSF